MTIPADAVPGIPGIAAPACFTIARVAIDRSVSDRQGHPGSRRDAVWAPTSTASASGRLGAGARDPSAASWNRFNNG